MQLGFPGDEPPSGAEIIHPMDEWKPSRTEINNESMVWKISAGESTILMTGDIEREVELELLEELSKKDYDTIVDDLVEIENVGDLPDEDILSRYYPQLQSTDNFGMDNTKWFYRMINSKKPLQEKMTLFWHHVFATGWTKSEQGPTMIDHIAMLRDNCLLNLRILLRDLAADPAMIFWLDNCENHGKNINHIVIILTRYMNYMKEARV